MTTSSVPAGEQPADGDRPTELVPAAASRADDGTGATSTDPNLPAAPDLTGGSRRAGRSLPQHQPQRALSVLGLYLLSLAVLAMLLLAVFATALAVLLLIAAAFGLSVVVAVLAPAPRPDSQRADERPVLRRSPLDRDHHNYDL